MDKPKDVELLGSFHGAKLREDWCCVDQLSIGQLTSELLVGTGWKEPELDADTPAAETAFFTQSMAPSVACSVDWKNGLFAGSVRRCSGIQSSSVETAPRSVSRRQKMHLRDTPSVGRRTTGTAALPPARCASGTSCSSRR